MSAQTLIAFISEHESALWARIAEHLAMAGVATAAALVVGVLMAILSYRNAMIRRPLLTIVSLLQTVPGIALLVMMMAVLHRIGAAPAIATLFLFALLPIVQNTVVALGELPPTLAEAARGLGLTKWQQLRYVRLPLALPAMVAGLRIAAVQTVGLATLAAFVGAGGLGQFINRGLFLSDTRLILLGAIPAALIAVIIDQLISLVQRAVTPQHSMHMRKLSGWSAVLLAALLIAFTLHHASPDHAAPVDTVVIGSKNFTEQFIVAEMVAQQIERRTHFHVVRQFGLGGSNVLHAALVQGNVTIAVEYTGTALASILHQPVPDDRRQILPLLRKQYQQRYGLTWLEPLGFNNSYVLAIRGDDKRLADTATISQLASLAPALDAAFDFEFAERPDGYPGLQRAYGLEFKRVRDMHPDLMYSALAARETDVISAYSTDGRLARGGIRVLRDDKSFFPPYQAAIIAPEKLLQTHPDLAAALAALSGTLNEDRMRALNAAVDKKQMTVEQAARLALDATKQ